MSAVYPIQPLAKGQKPTAAFYLRLMCFPDLSRSALVALCVSALGLQTSTAQRPPEQPDAARILHEMQKLNVLGSVLYIAAHPDDENTRLITWLANGKKVRTGYLSLTRGEGGQNLIGPELGDALGIIRTQELLEARRIDGGEQFFTRAVDFGYSKSAKESFEKWGHDEVLSDVVRVIRTFRPDIIITRFPPTREAGHGHHEASAILAREAFDLAGDPKAFPEHLEQGLEVWQPRRLFFNGSTFWKQDLAEYVKKDSANDWYSVDVGGYDPLLGLSYTEIAGRSRSMHKSQGFGAAETRGEMIEYLQLIAGDKPRTKDIFEGIDMTWGRINGHRSGALRSKVIDSFDAGNVVAAIPGLAAISAHLDSILWVEEYPDLLDWIHQKAVAIESLLIMCSGFSVEALSTEPSLAQNDTMDVRIVALDRTGTASASGLEMVTKGIRFLEPDPYGPALLDTTIEITLLSKIDQPYWLANPHGTLYVGREPSYGVMPRELNIVTGSILVGMHAGESIVRSRSEFELMNKRVDRVVGERIRPVYVTPVASIIPKSNVLIASGGPQQIEVEIEALTDSLTGQLNVFPPEGWMTTKDLKLVNIAKRNTRQSFSITLVPTENAKAGAVAFEFTGPKGKADRTLHEIDYPHIMPQVYYTPAEVKLVPLDVKVNAKTVGYIKGAGDEVPAAIEQLGVEVEMIDPSSATLESLRKYDAIVTGIRAYNTIRALKELNPVLMKYMEEGGTLVVQYNTLSRDMVLPDSLFGPYPFHLTRDRVTVEEASCTLLKGDHPLLTSPNKIDPSDFDSWTQERGLYFCGSLDPRYTPLLSWNDPGEDPLNGALITCDYGKGRYVYTGISFFRQLPAGVPGAYRLFANLISKRGN